MFASIGTEFTKPPTVVSIRAPAPTAVLADRTLVGHNGRTWL